MVSASLTKTFQPFTAGGQFCHRRVWQLSTGDLRMHTVPRGAGHNSEEMLMPSGRKGRTALAAVAGAAVLAVAGAPAVASGGPNLGSTTTPIKHLVVIF